MTLLWSVVLLSICSMIEPTSINFLEGNVSQAQELAEESGKMVLVELYASWCASCRLMEETTFQSKRVVERVTTEFIAVRLDINELEGKLFAIEHNVQILPALIIINSQGEIIGQVEKAIGNDEMIRLLDACR
ncbi:MAG: thioredoxin family protein [Saprospiraceae bacterium]|nr:thioredoxin family protein [Saprospiraceae bacterium]